MDLLEPRPLTEGEGSPVRSIGAKREKVRKGNPAC